MQGRPSRGTSRKTRPNASQWVSEISRAAKRKGPETGRFESIFSLVAGLDLNLRPQRSECCSSAGITRSYPYTEQSAK